MRLSPWQKQRELLGMGTPEYNEGKQSYFDNKKLVDNPYPSSSKEALAWKYGWNKAPRNNP